MRVSDNEFRHLGCPGRPQSFRIAPCSLPRPCVGLAHDPCVMTPKRNSLTAWHINVAVHLSSPRSRNAGTALDLGRKPGTGCIRRSADPAWSVTFGMAGYATSGRGWHNPAVAGLLRRRSPRPEKLAVHMPDGLLPWGALSMDSSLHAPVWLVACPICHHCDSCTSPFLQVHCGTSSHRQVRTGGLLTLSVNSSGMPYHLPAPVSGTAQPSMLRCVGLDLRAVDGTTPVPDSAPIICENRRW